MSHNTAPKDSIQHALRELLAARDEVRLRMHLLSLETRHRWGELEAKLLFFQDQVSDGGERVAEAALAKARELTYAVRDFVEHSVARTELDTPARELMTRHVRTCSVDDSLNCAAQIMWEVNCGSVPVIDTEGKLCGIITDRDVCMAAYTRGQPLPTVKVHSAMSHRVYACSASDPLERVLDLMKERQVRRVPLTDDAGRVIGIISLADIARHAQGPGEDAALSTHLLATLAGVSSDPKRESRQSGSVAA
jgi:CBS domain-containing protein